jgi:hypothetical protein
MRLTHGTSWIEGKTPVPFDLVRISDITEPSAPFYCGFSCSVLIHLRPSEDKGYPVELDKPCQSA